MSFDFRFATESLDYLVFVNIEVISDRDSIIIKRKNIVLSANSTIAEKSQVTQGNFKLHLTGGFYSLKNIANEKVM